MKTPDTAKAVSSATRQGAQIISPGGLPAKLNTVTAEVLARLLNYERLTSLDAVDEASTTRLSAVTFYLAEKYGWPIEAMDKAAAVMAAWHGWLNTSLTRKSWPAQWLLALATGAPRYALPAAHAVPMQPRHDARQSA